MDNTVHSYLEELAAIERWNREFGDDERNSSSYLARERRRWELLLKLEMYGKAKLEIPDLLNKSA